MDDLPWVLRGYLNTLLLAVLQCGPLPYAEILDALRESCGGSAGLSKGNIYPALHRLEHLGLVAGRSSLVEGRHRRAFGLTEAGWERLESDRQKWREHVAAMSALIGSSPAGVASRTAPGSGRRRRPG